MKGSDMKVGATYALETRYGSTQRGELLTKGVRVVYSTISVDALEEVAEHDEIVAEHDDCVIVRRLREASGWHAFKVEPRECSLPRSRFVSAERRTYDGDVFAWESRQVLGEWNDYRRQQKEAEERRVRSREERERRNESRLERAEELRGRVAALGLEGALSVACGRVGGTVDEPRLRVLDADKLLTKLEGDVAEFNYAAGLSDEAPAL